MNHRPTPFHSSVDVVMKYSKEGLSATNVEKISIEADVLALYGLERDSDGLIGWRPDSKEHPRNWSAKRKIYDTTVIILLELYT